MTPANACIAWRADLRLGAHCRATACAGVRHRTARACRSPVWRSRRSAEYYTPPDHSTAASSWATKSNTTRRAVPLRRLINDLCTYLSVRDGGVQRFVLRLEHEDRHTDVEVGLLAAEREPAMLFELTSNRLERVSIPKPVVAMRLLARELPPFVPAARDLFDVRAQQNLPWPQLRERLRARLGDEAVYRVVPAGDPRPERAWRRDDGRPML